MTQSINTAALPQFSQLSIQGEDAEKFLQGQLTCDVTKLGLSYQAAAIGNLKGRIEFGIWIKKQAEKHFDMVISADCAEAFQGHLKKFGAFSKCDTSAPTPIYPCVIDEVPTFSHQDDHNTSKNIQAWMQSSIATGNYWIVAATQGEFQPQELRLHQRGGMDYDKGCYLGQEVIARIYFKSAPKAFLHYVKGTSVKGSGTTPVAGEKLDKVQVVNAITTSEGFEALVVARPEQLAESSLTILDLPLALQADVARPK
ncbi:YgfZ/GcvT domain-containing protein [Psychrobacter cryohalolentis]|uniref:Glycine cleavage T protein (Aminomethyl transferase) n=1 Tax=Psychrobacter cryohalolentis (strain ATCC BAA-1226 / DSM 17306 / VKM B-2378 / K5) TaxID=335284 RepID=Q1QEF0_PSYCK|nr:glycine cleavage system protein T [Psychrobacter cryohalolentis]ABE73953.1 glycine cleavage T protein (aminomethyl transferase) [Psychrobacter cryohalolentis K5]ASE26590.1 folate-binding Fe/S cluster repair protein [Psychrobacter cryohalolentis]